MHTSGNKYKNAWRIVALTNYQFPILFPLLRASSELKAVRKDRMRGISVLQSLQNRLGGKGDKCLMNNLQGQGEEQEDW